MCVIFSMSDSFIQFGKKNLSVSEKHRFLHGWKWRFYPHSILKYWQSFCLFLLGGNRWMKMIFWMDSFWIYLSGPDPLTFNSEILEDPNRWNWYFRAFLKRVVVFKFYSDVKLSWQLGYINCKFKRYALSKNFNCLQGTVSGIFPWRSHFC